MEKLVQQFPSTRRQVPRPTDYFTLNIVSRKLFRMDNLKKRIASFQNALNGILHAFKTEVHFRFHVLAALIAIALAVFFKINQIEWMIILLCIAAVLSSELLNTAIERICDRITKDRDPLIGNAKDLAAGSVLIISAITLIIGAIIFTPYIVQFVQEIYK